MYIVILGLTLIGSALADYECLCNYHVEREVYGVKDAQSQPTGYLYEFDCKPTYGAGQQNWQPIQYEKQVQCLP